MKPPKRNSKVCDVSLLQGSDEIESLYRLLDELDGFSADQTDAALIHLLKTLGKLVRADNVQWYAAVRVMPGEEVQVDPMLGWRLRAMQMLVPDSEDYSKLTAWLHTRHKPCADIDLHIGMATRAMVVGAGTFQAHRMRDGWINFEAFQKTDHYQYHYEELGIADRIWISFPLNDDTESMFLLDHHQPQSRFSERDIALLSFVIRSIRGFHRRLFLSHGLHIGDAPLSPSKRRLLQQLFTGNSEKEIAHSLGYTTATTSQYIKAIYRSFGVSNRASLMTLWLGS